ncbi:MAG: hypothetical protein IPF79_05865 [Ignavibacteria bacterium]|nr:hypothetical protein [Ignavibacteria bacterium]
MSAQPRVILAMIDRITFVILGLIALSMNVRSQSMVDMWPSFEDFGDRPVQNWRVGIAPGLAFPVANADQWERTITWAIDVEGRIPKSPFFIVAGYRYVDIDESGYAWFPETPPEDRDRSYKGAVLGVEMELADKRKTLLTTVRMTAGYPVTSVGSFNIETGIMLDVYVIAGGSFTLDVSVMTGFDPVEIIWVPVRIGMRWGM